MTARDILKRLLHALGGAEPVAARRLARIGRAGDAIILNLHRVAPDDGSAYRPLEPGLFRETLRFLRRHCRLTTLAGLPRHAQPGDRPAVVLSFDDGYRDFIDYAAPILEEFSVRANMNVIPGAAESGLPPFNVLVQDLIGKTAPRDIPQPLRRLFRDALGLDIAGDPVAVSAAIKTRPMAAQQALAAEALPAILALPGFRPTAMMTVAEIGEIAPHHEIGLHSYHHATMSAETDDYFARDLQDCLAWCRDRLGQAPRIYAFPNGACRQSQVDLLQDAGFTAVLLVGERFTRPAARVHPRFNFDARSLPEARFRTAGGRAGLKAG